MDKRITNLLVTISILLLFAGALFLFNKFKEKTSERITFESEALLLFLEGDVKVKTVKTNEWITAEADMPLLNGYMLKTGKGSWAEIGLGSGLKNTVVIRENTLAEFTTIVPTQISLLKGEIRSLVEGLEEGSAFEIKTPMAVCGARGTGWDTTADERGVALDVYEDEVYFQSTPEKKERMKAAIIDAGRRATLKSPEEDIAVENLTPEKIEKWKSWKKNFSERRDIKIKGKKGSKVWVEKTGEGDFTLMVEDEEEKDE